MMFVFFKLNEKQKHKKRECNRTFLRWYGIQIPLLALFVLRMCFRLLFHGLELIKQGFITDFKDLRGLAAVPTGLGKYTSNGLALRLHGGTAPDLQQRRHLQFAIAAGLNRWDGRQRWSGPSQGRRGID